MEWAENLILGIGLAAAAIQDLKTRTISLRGLGLLALAGAALTMIQCVRQGSPVQGAEAMLGLLPGLAVLGISRMTKGAIGEGDAWLLMVCGLFLGTFRVLILFWSASVLIMLAGCVLMIKKRGNRKTALPMAPILLGAHLIMWMGGVL